MEFLVFRENDREPQLWENVHHIDGLISIHCRGNGRSWLIRLEQSSCNLKNTPRICRSTELSKPEEVMEQVDSRTVAASPLPCDVKIEDVESFFGQHGKAT